MASSADAWNSAVADQEKREDHLRRQADASAFPSPSPWGSSGSQLGQFTIPAGAAGDSGLIARRFASQIGTLAVVGGSRPQQASTGSAFGGVRPKAPPPVSGDVFGMQTSFGASSNAPSTTTFGGGPTSTGSTERSAPASGFGSFGSFGASNAANSGGGGGGGGSFGVAQPSAVRGFGTDSSSQQSAALGRGQPSVRGFGRGPSANGPSAGRGAASSSGALGGMGRGAMSVSGDGAPSPHGLGDLLQPTVKQEAAPRQPLSEGDSKEENDALESTAAASLLNKLVHDKLVQMHDTAVTVLQADPSKPYFSIKSFEELRLKPELIKGLYEMGFNQPSKIQECALPVLLCEPPVNMIAQSQSGTGKTAAFALTMLTRANPDDHFPQCICLAPTYELAIQIGEVMQRMGKYLPEVRIAYATRGQRVARGSQVTEQVIIGTPGTTLDWLFKLRCFDPARVRVFVLDEADVMISQQGHQDQCIRILNELKRTTDTCQCLLFSATYDEPVMSFAGSVVGKDSVVEITLRREEQTLDNIKQFYVHCNDREHKFRVICNLYGSLTIGSSIIFCYVCRRRYLRVQPAVGRVQTKRSAKWLCDKMVDMGHRVALLSGELDIEQRAQVIREFKAGEHKVLITTNVCARGIDVQQVTVVINYDPPTTFDRQPDYETYLHRIGRTGRFGKPGLAFNFCDGPRSLDIIKQIESYFGTTIEMLEADDMEKIEAIEN